MGAVQETFDVLPNYFDLEAENRFLREQNLVLSDQLSRMREAAVENSRLRAQLELKEKGLYRYLAANVVGKNFQLLRSSITLDVGEDDGVVTNMPVVTHGGLVGKVVATNAWYAVVHTLFHQEMRTSAKVERSRADGILVWEGGEGLKLKNVAKTLDVQVGDLVVTSEYSSIFPAGIPIGIVSRTSEVRGDLFQTIEVAPSADLLRLEEVFVITELPDTNKIALEHRFSR
jgi:rod shape-determining protein MreC